MRLIPTLASLALACAPMGAAACGGSFSTFVDGLKAEAIGLGHAPATVDAFFAGVQADPAVLRADRSQGVFQKPFLDFSRALISQNRLDNGAANLARYSAIFDRAEGEFGVSRGVIAAFWADRKSVV